MCQYYNCNIKEILISFRMTYATLRIYIQFLYCKSVDKENYVNKFPKLKLNAYSFILCLSDRN